MKEEADYFQDTKNKLSGYIQQRLLLFRLQATKKISHIAAGVITVIVIAVIGLFLLIFGSITAGFWLSDITGSIIAGFGIVALFYFLVFLFVILFLRKILRNFFINKLIHTFHKKKSS